MVFTAFVLCSLRLVNSKQKAKQYLKRLKTSPQSYKYQIKILSCLGLAYWASGEQPSSEVSPLNRLDRDNF